jgi:hypothetical protein
MLLTPRKIRQLGLPHLKALAQCPQYAVALALLNATEKN